MWTTQASRRVVDRGRSGAVTQVSLVFSISRSVAPVVSRKKPRQGKIGPPPAGSQSSKPDWVEVYAVDSRSRIPKRPRRMGPGGPRYSFPAWYNPTRAIRIRGVDHAASSFFRDGSSGARLRRLARRLCLAITRTDGGRRGRLPD